MFMSRIDGRKIILITAILTALIMISSSPVTAQSLDDPIEFGDYQELMDEFNESTGRFGDIQTGSWVIFTDKVVYSKINADENTESYLNSTGGSMYSPHLVFLGPEIDDLLKKGAEIEFTVRIVEVLEGNISKQVIAPYNEGVKVIVEGSEDGEEDPHIEVFGIRRSIPEKWDTSWARFFIVLAIWTAGSIIIWLAFFLAIKLSKKTKTVFDEQVLGIVTAPVFVILLLYGLLISLSQFDMDKKLIDILDKVYWAATIILVAYISIKVFKRVILVYLKIMSKKTETQADDILAPFLGKVITVAIWIVAFVMFLKVFGIDITVFVAGMGIIGLVIAFAAQDTLSNFFAGIMILLDRPFKEGDIIMLDDSGYEVRHIGLRSTRLFHTISNRLVTIPNNKISDHLFANLNEPDFKGRKTVEVGVGYDHDPREIGNLLIEIANSHPDAYVDKDHQPHYRFQSFGDSSLNFTLTFWVKDFNDQWRVASELRERIYSRFASEGIEIPFPQRVVHMASDAPLQEMRTVSKPAPGDMKNLAP
jgi:small-conductance mechanosensitive channel